MRFLVGLALAAVLGLSSIVVSTPAPAEAGIIVAGPCPPGYGLVSVESYLGSPLHNRISRVDGAVTDDGLVCFKVQFRFEHVPGPMFIDNAFTPDQNGV